MHHSLGDEEPRNDIKEGLTDENYETDCGVEHDVQE